VVGFNSPQQLLDIPPVTAMAVPSDEGPKRKMELVDYPVSDDEADRSVVKVPRWSEAVQQPASGLVSNIAACAVAWGLLPLVSVEGAAADEAGAQEAKAAAVGVSAKPYRDPELAAIALSAVVWQVERCTE
jgi:hypothetical protein